MAEIARLQTLLAIPDSLPPTPPHSPLPVASISLLPSAPSPQPAVPAPAPAPAPPAPVPEFTERDYERLLRRSQLRSASATAAAGSTTDTKTTAKGTAAGAKRNGTVTKRASATAASGKSDTKSDTDQSVGSVGVDCHTMSARRHRQPMGGRDGRPPITVTKMDGNQGFGTVQFSAEYASQLFGANLSSTAGIAFQADMNRIVLTNQNAGLSDWIEPANEFVLERFMSAWSACDPDSIPLVITTSASDANNQIAAHMCYIHAQLGVCESGNGRARGRDVRPRDPRDSARYAFMAGQYGGGVGLSAARSLLGKKTDTLLKAMDDAAAATAAAATAAAATNKHNKQKMTSTTEEPELMMMDEGRFADLGDLRPMCSYYDQECEIVDVALPDPDHPKWNVVEGSGGKKGVVAGSEWALAQREKEKTALAQLRALPQSVVGVVLEPFVWSRDGHSYTPWFLRQLAQILVERKLLLCWDEAWGGAARCGPMWSHQLLLKHAPELVPDLITFGKSMGVSGVARTILDRSVITTTSAATAAAAASRLATTAVPPVKSTKTKSKKPDAKTISPATADPSSPTSAPCLLGTGMGWDDLKQPLLPPSTASIVVFGAGGGGGGGDVDMTAAGAAGAAVSIKKQKKGTKRAAEEAAPPPPPPPTQPTRTALELAREHKLAVMIGLTKWAEPTTLHTSTHLLEFVAKRMVVVTVSSVGRPILYNSNARAVGERVRYHLEERCRLGGPPFCFKKSTPATSSVCSGDSKSDAASSTATAAPVPVVNLSHGHGAFWVFDYSQTYDLRIAVCSGQRWAPPFDCTPEDIDQLFDPNCPIGLIKPEPPTTTTTTTTTPTAGAASPASAEVEQNHFETCRICGNNSDPILYECERCPNLYCKSCLQRIRDPEQPWAVKFRGSAEWIGVCCRVRTSEQYRAVKWHAIKEGLQSFGTGTGSGGASTAAAASSLNTSSLAAATASSAHGKKKKK